MTKDQQDRLLRAAQDVVKGALAAGCPGWLNEATSQLAEENAALKLVIIDLEVFDGLRAIVQEISDDAVREIEEIRFKPSPLENCADGAAEWEIDAKMAERAEDDGPVLDWIFTFGLGHSVYGGGRFVRIRGTWREARLKMIERYGREWAFQYENEIQAGVEKWGLKEVFDRREEPL